VAAGANGIIEMHGPLCTLDRPDGNDPLQPLRHRVPEFPRKRTLKTLIAMYSGGICRLTNPGDGEPYGYGFLKDRKKSEKRMCQKRIYE
jgi:hypothetical protein